MARVVAPWVALCALASLAMGNERETVTFENVSSAGVLDSPSNAVFFVELGGGYVATVVAISGTLTEVDTDTWASDARVIVTPPEGSNIGRTIIQPFNSGNFNGSIAVAAKQTELDRPVSASTGSWVFRFYEDVVDNAGGADATWSSVSFTFIDAPLPTWVELADAAETVSGAQRVQGSGTLQRVVGSLTIGDTDIYRISICDPASFSATTIDGATWDTQLYLFRVNGLGVAFNDDAPGSGLLQSRLSNRFVTQAGEYLLAVSRFDRRPLDSARRPLWLDEPFDTERAPDGTGAGSALNRWLGTANRLAGNYRVRLTGACFVAQPATCPADVDDGSGSGTPDLGVDIQDLLYYLSQFALGTVDADLDNGTFNGQPDGGVDINDLLYFLLRFSEGC